MSAVTASDEAFCRSASSDSSELTAMPAPAAVAHDHPLQRRTIQVGEVGGQVGDGEDDPRAGVLEYELGLLTLEDGVDRDRDRARPERSQVEHRELRNVRQVERDPVPARDPQAAQQVGRPVAGLVQLAIREAAPLEEDGRPIREEAPGPSHALRDVHLIRSL